MSVDAYNRMEEASDGGPSRDYQRGYEAGYAEYRVAAERAAAVIGAKMANQVAQRAAAMKALERATALGEKAANLGILRTVQRDAAMDALQRIAAGTWNADSSERDLTVRRYARQALARLPE